MGLFGHRCGACGARFRSEADLMNHEQLAHSDPGYDCRRCGVTFPSMEEMRTHLQREHGYGGRR